MIRLEHTLFSSYLAIPLIHKRISSLTQYVVLVLILNSLRARKKLLFEKNEWEMEVELSFGAKLNLYLISFGAYFAFYILMANKPFHHIQSCRLACKAKLFLWTIFPCTSFNLQQSHMIKFAHCILNNNFFLFTYVTQKLE